MAPHDYEQIADSMDRARVQKQYSEGRIVVFGRALRPVKSQVSVVRHLADLCGTQKSSNGCVAICAGTD